MGEIIMQFEEEGIIGRFVKTGDLVRCKDCKYYEEQDETIGTCLLTESGAHVKGYCAWAERKEE